MRCGGILVGNDTNPTVCMYRILEECCNSDGVISSRSALALITDYRCNVRAEMRAECAKVATEYVGKILTLYQGKLPFVFFKSTEQSDADRDASMAQYIAERIAQAILVSDREDEK